MTTGRHLGLLQPEVVPYSIRGDPQNPNLEPNMK